MHMKEGTPIITADAKPFRFVCREADSWNPTLDEVNSRSYDYVKLHRMSTYLDVGIAPFSLGVCFDGTLFSPRLSSTASVKRLWQSSIKPSLNF